MAGRVLSVKVDVGDTVKAGQLLAEMDPVDIDQRLTSLDASIERARSAYSAALAQQADAKAGRLRSRVKDGLWSEFLRRFRHPAHH